MAGTKGFYGQHRQVTEESIVIIRIYMATFQNHQKLRDPLRGKMKRGRPARTCSKQVEEDICIDEREILMEGYRNEQAEDELPC